MDIRKRSIDLLSKFITIENALKVIDEMIKEADYFNNKVRVNYWLDVRNDIKKAL